MCTLFTVPPQNISDPRISFPWNTYLGIQPRFLYKLGYCCLHVCFPRLFHHSAATSQHVFFKALAGALGYRRLQLHQLLQSLIEALWCEFVLLPESDREMKTTWLKSPAPLYRGISGINSVWGCAQALTLKMAPPGVIIRILLQWMIIKANSIALSQAPALLDERERKNYRENKAAIWVNC